MSSRTLLIVILTVMAVALAGPASAFYDDDREIEFVPSTAYFTPTATGVSNLDTEVTGERIGWGAEAPAGLGGRSVATAHAGLLSIFGDDAAYDRQSFTAAGTVTGYLENIALDLYYASPVNNLCGMALSIDLFIDGKQVMNMDGIGNTEDVITYQYSDDYFLAQVALVNIAEQMERLNIFGDADTVHEVELTALQYPLCQEAVWTYGSAEAPSRLSFNLDPKGSTVKLYSRWDVNNPPRSDAA